MDWLQKLNAKDGLTITEGNPDLSEGNPKADGDLCSAIKEASSTTSPANEIIPIAFKAAMVDCGYPEITTTSSVGEDEEGAYLSSFSKINIYGEDQSYMESDYVHEEEDIGAKTSETGTSKKSAKPPFR